MKSPATAIAAEAEPIGGLIYTAFWIPSLPCIWRVILTIDTGCQVPPMRFEHERAITALKFVRTGSVIRIREHACLFVTSSQLTVPRLRSFRESPP